jgi:MFS family permease
VRRLTAATGGVAATPLVVLFLLNLVDEFDRVAFGVLSPEIRDAFGLSDSGIVAVGSLAGVTALLAALPIGVLADRVRRVRLSAVGAAAWGGFTVLTALSPAVWVLTIARMGAGVGRIVNEPVHASLLTDYYPTTHHPRVFALHRMANPIGLASALAVGALAAVFDWRLVFGLLCVPTFLLLPFLLRLREPSRGESIDPAAALAASGAPRASFLQARKILFGVKTLRRLWIGLPVVGIALITLPQLISLFFEREYGYGPTGRGFVTFLSGVGILVGLALGQKLATGAFVTGRPERLATYDGCAIVGIGVALLGLVLSPWAWLSAVCYLLAGIANGAYQPNYFSLVALVSPARVRAQAYAWAILWLGVGALIAPLLAGVGEEQGYRLAIGILAVTLLAGGVAATTARGSVRHDAERARAELTGEAVPQPVPAEP